VSDTIESAVREAIQSAASLHLAFTLGQCLAAGMTREEIIEMIDLTEREMRNPTASTVDLLKGLSTGNG